MEFNHRDWLICEPPIGDGQFLFHRVAPRFVAEIFDEMPLDSLTLALLNGQTLGKIEWIDEPVTSTVKLVEICEAASKAIEMYDRILDHDVYDSGDADSPAGL